MFDDKIDSLIKKYVAGSRDSKLSIGMIVNQKQYVFHYNHEGLCDECYSYEIGSITKTVTAHLVMKLVGEGLLDLETSAGDYLGLTGAYPTVYELLTHTSGYGFVTPWEYTCKALPFYYKKNIYETVTRDKVFSAFQKRKKQKDCGYAYSDFNYAVLALVLEAVTHKPIKELLDRFIKEDLGLCHTHLLTDGCPNTAPIYKNRVVARWKWHGDNPYLSAGGIYSNAADMVTYMDLQLTSRAAYIQHCHAVNEKAKPRNGKLLICPGWHAYKNGNHLWHVGGVSCYKSSIIISKNKHIGVVALGNSHGKKGDNIRHLVNMIYGYLVRNRNKL